MLDSTKDIFSLLILLFIWLMAAVTYFHDIKPSLPLADDKTSNARLCCSYYFFRFAYLDWRLIDSVGHFLSITLWFLSWNIFLDFWSCLLWNCGFHCFGSFVCQVLLLSIRVYCFTTNLRMPSSHSRSWYHWFSTLQLREYLIFWCMCRNAGLNNVYTKIVTS